MSQTTALLIIDAQLNMFDENHPIYKAEGLLQNLQTLISKASKAAIPVFFVQNNGGVNEPDEPSTPGWLIHPALAPSNNDNLIQKTTENAFYQTSLKQKLDELAVKRLVIAGMQTDFCVNATTRGAVALGYEVILVSDAHSTFDSSNLSASQIIDQHNVAFGKLGKLLTTSQVGF
ncbi:MAG: cysteine hydrolase [Chloroflexi bacterium]|uniref:Cysteine hydrolase n=1 Tax=Candidatus Chlorohelix allophototropha TaxID=3003348 RepID=A0A8T7M714_9CHLR|nr:cysteine hydrolase [Chloroflexota bacterium]WJW69812.1 cysteine hydrolase [Chloroflexota bacterium L227-S17]